METPLPNPDKLKSLNVNESRAKRLERQHARMRDRGGIFRPENNSNLFDLLRSATHRKSPTKGKGRSRSRSVSPLKKTATSNGSQQLTGNKKPTRELTTCKTTSNAALAPVSEVAEDEIESQNKRPKGKQKIDEAHAKQPKVKTKKSAPAKKTTAKKSRRTAKQSVADGEPEGDNTNNKIRQTKPRPRGRRKKQDVDNRVPADPEIHPLCPIVADKDISSPLPANCPVPEKATAQLHIKKPASKAQRPPIDQPATADQPNESIHKSPKLPPKPNSRKRKVENAETDDESRPQKVLKPHPKSQRSKTPSSECKPKPNELSEADLACKALEEVHVNKACDISKKTKRTAKSKLDELLDTMERSGAYVEETESKTTSKPAMKRSRIPMEDDGEPAMRVKKTKIDPLTDVLETNTAVLQKPDSSRPRSAEKSDSTGRRPKIIPSKRKENATAVEKKSNGGRGSRTKKQGSGLPAHIRQKLNAQRHEKHTSDDEPDPIDFLS